MITYGILSITGLLTSVSAYNGMNQAISTGVHETSGFFDSLIGLVAADTLAKPHFNSIPESQAIRESANRKGEAVINYFLNNEVLPQVEPALDSIFGQAVCDATVVDSFEYTIGIQVVPPHNPKFTLRDVNGVIAGFCVDSVIAIAQTDSKVRIETANDYNIDVTADSLTARTWRSMRTSGDVFIPSLAPEPFVFTGQFAWQTITSGMFDSIEISLQKQIPTSGWGPVAQFCVNGVSGAPKATSVSNCKSIGLQIEDPSGANICGDIGTLCDEFIQAFCGAVTESVIGATLSTNWDEISKNVNGTLPVCIPFDA